MFHASDSRLTGATLPWSLLALPVRRLSAPLLLLLAVWATLFLPSTPSWAAPPAGSLAYSWGDNEYGKLGNGSTTDSHVPVPVDTSGVLSGKTVVQVVAGDSHSLALCSDGTLAAWGYNNDGELGNGSTTDSHVPVPVDTSGVLSGKTVVQVAAGTYHSLALCSDGTLVAWGYNGYGQLGNNSTTDSHVPVLVNTSGVLSGKTVVQVAAGAYHSLAVCSDGTLVAWGYNGYGELGNNSTTNSSVPVLVDTSGVLSGKTVTQVAAGTYHSLALCSDGTLVAWGYNGDGELGNGSTNKSTVPVLVDTSGVLSGKTVVQVAAGAYHSLALCSDGTLVAWGYNGYGELGNNSTTDSHVPVAVVSNGVLSGKTVTQVAAGYVHSLALCSDGTLVAWGYNNNGQLGTGSTTDSSVPVLVDRSGALKHRLVSQLMQSNQSFHTLVIAAPGANNTPVLAVNKGLRLARNAGATVIGTSALQATDADSDTITFTLATVPAQGLLKLNTTTLGVGDTFTQADIDAGKLTFTPNTGAARGSDSFQFTAADGYGGTIPLTSFYITLTDPPPPSGSLVYSWGDNGNGQLGNGNTTNSSVPVLVTTSGVLQGKTVVQVAAGNGHSLALCSDGTLVAWGYNGDGELGNGSTTDSHVPVLVDTSGVLQGKTVVQVAAGQYHSLALCSDGTLAAWGDNGYGQLGNNSTAQSNVPVLVDTSGVLSGKTVAQVAAGAYHSLALCSDGTVVAWGRNLYGQLGSNSTSDSHVPVLVDTSGVLSGKTVTQVAAGSVHSLALCSDGTLVAWGYNGDGELGNGSTTDSHVSGVGGHKRCFTRQDRDAGGGGPISFGGSL